MMSFLLVALGGAAGASARYGVSLAATHWLGAGFPWATLIVNVVGGFAIGLLMGLASAQDKTTILLLGTGVLGGFTTFSAFSIETLRLIERNDWTLAGVNVLASVTLSLAACAAGLALARSLS